MATAEDADEEGSGSGRNQIDQLDMIKSYATFAWRAVKHRKLLAGLAFVTVFGIAVGVLSLWPRTYNCQSTILIQNNAGALTGFNDNAFLGAADIVRRRENIQRIIKETDLGRLAIEQRTDFQRFKDRVLGRNPQPEAYEAILVWQLQSMLWVNQQGETLTFGVDWGNPQTAALLVGSAQKVYLEARHIAEISTIQEKMAIMDGHAIKVRKEIDAIAEQLRGVREEKITAFGKAAAPAPATSGSGAPAATPPPRRRPPIKLATVVTNAVSEGEQAARKEELDTLKQDLEAKKNALKELKGQQSQSLSAAQAQKAELLTRYTPAHPEVVVLERKIQALSGESPRIAPLQQDIAELTQKIKELESASAVASTRPRSGGGGGGGSGPATPKAEALPADILRLLDSGTEADPAVTVQLQGAISKYAMLRDQIRTARIELDTAQAAFNHRYKVVEPPEPPNKPSKPNVQGVLLGAFFGSLLLAILLPMLAELRKGKIVERWQVYQMKLPILAELRLPSGSSD